MDCCLFVLLIISDLKVAKSAATFAFALISTISFGIFSNSSTVFIFHAFVLSSTNLNLDNTL
jgi:hypothetical protein